MALHGRVVVWMSLVVAVAGCETPKEITPAARPTAAVLGVRVQDVQLDYATLIFEVRIHNPLAKPVQVKGLRYGLSSGPNTFLSGTPVSDVTIAPATAEVVLLRDMVVCERFLRALDARMDTTVPFTLELRLFLEGNGRQTMQTPARSRGQLFLPPLPQAAAAEGVEKPLDVIYIATPQDVVEKMLTMARVQRDSVVYDLGCGDGRALVTAARGYGCRARGYDLDPRRVQESREEVLEAGVGPLVTVEQRDIFTVDLQPADVIFLYLNPVVNRRLIPQLQSLRPGARIVSHSFPIGDIKPDEVVKMVSREDGHEHIIYLWTAPLQVD